MAKNNDTIFKSGRHKHKEGWSWIICQTIRYRLELLNTHTLTKMSIDEMSIINDNDIKHYGHCIYLWKTQKWRMMIIGNMSNNNDTLCNSGRHKNKQRWS